MEEGSIICIETFFIEEAVADLMIKGGLWYHLICACIAI
jgi:hypothetical protein